MVSSSTYTYKREQTNKETVNDNDDDNKENDYSNNSKDNSTNNDPWKGVSDLRGDQHYINLGVARNATASEIKLAYRKKAREHHPDKGGTEEMFDKVQKAFECLIDPRKREVYDTLQHVAKYRYIPGVTQRAAGGEDLLLDDIARLGLETDASTQLVVLCEVCGRPSTRICICSLYYCDFCERKQHWKGEFGLHWPCTQSDNLKIELGKKDLEVKKKEDARRHELEDPNFRDPSALRTIREFKENAAEIYSGKKTKTHHTKYFDMRLSKYYMWAQTTRHVYIAVMLPTGYEDKHLHMEVKGRVLVLQSEDSPPVIERQLAFDASEEFPIQTLQTEDKRFFVMSVPKKTMGFDIKQAFEGDPDFARCLQPPYTLFETNTEVIMEFELPFWIDEADVRVDITKRSVRVRVTNEIDTERTFWRKTSGPVELRSNWEAIIPEECAWSLDDESINSSGEKCRILMICFAKPEADEEERDFKKGKRQDNRFATSKGSISATADSGVRFFYEDEDEFDLEAMLIAMVYMEQGKCFVPAKPEAVYRPPFDASKIISDVNALPERIQKILETMLEGEEHLNERENLEALGNSVL
jgi:hypothetical protein